jgi:regulator of sirC expression with transglutaminase-like and TPR domain
VEVVRRTLSLPDDRLDYAEAKLAFDRAIDPSIDADWVLAELDSMTVKARELAGASPDDAAKLNALRKLIYESGPWNAHRSSEYDHADPFGPNSCNSRLDSYLRTGRGNCVSMPILFLILGERLRLDLSLALAPGHMLVIFRAKSGCTLNLETTSGAQPARLEWLRQEMPMSDLALTNGVYMRPLPKREAVAHMASTIGEHMIETGRYGEALALAELILSRLRHPHFMTLRSQAYDHVIHREFGGRYPSEALKSPLFRARYLMLEQRSQASYDAALALGWSPGAGAVSVGGAPSICAPEQKFILSYSSR